MALDYKIVIPIGIAAIALLGFAGSSKAKGKNGTRPPSKCPPWQIDKSAILAAAQSALNQGMKGKERIASFVARSLYPVDAKNATIPWPQQPPWQLPLGMDEAHRCLWSEIILIIAELDIPPETAEVKPVDVLTPLIADSPTPGKFFLIQNANNACPPGGSNKPYCWYAEGKNGIFAQALRKIDAARGANANGHNYIKLCTTAGYWNANLYGRTGQSTTWPAYLKVDGVDIGTAWLPRHENAIATMINGKMPRRTINASGQKVGSGSSYGLLWIPPIDPDAYKQQGVISITGIKWGDGSSVLNPPPQLTSLLAA